jgi:purine-binding chemotaxis protein CheW
MTAEAEHGTNENMTKATADSKNTDRQQYLTFRLDGEYYGVDILQIQEIRGWGGVRNLPDMPACVQGVLDMRGTIVPIIDLRERLSIEKIAYDNSTVIIVVNVLGEDSQRIMGLVVDGVSDVLTLSQELIKQVDNLSSGIDVKYIDGMASVNENLVVLLNVNKLLTTEMAAVSQVCTA